MQGGSTALGAEARSEGPISIIVNGKEYRVRETEMAAKEIKALTRSPTHHMLILVGGDQGGDEPKADADTVRIEAGMRFRTVNSATFGSRLAMIPPMLQEHMDELRSRGFAVEATAGDAIYIVIKDYPIPDDIWDRSSSDLMIMAHDTYPNSKMDMFWLSPAISRRRGVTGGVDSDTLNGRRWQSFSWHVSGWDPAHDNLLTYLDVVDSRLRRDT